MEIVITSEPASSEIGMWWQIDFFGPTDRERRRLRTAFRRTGDLVKTDEFAASPAENARAGKALSLKPRYSTERFFWVGAGLNIDLLPFWESIHSSLGRTIENLMSLVRWDKPFQASFLWSP